MGILQTAERSSATDSSENVVFQRHLIAYKAKTAKLISGTVLEIGSGEGYGIRELVDKSDKYIAIDKDAPKINAEIKFKNITFIECEVPPLKDIDDNCIDYVVTFQVIEHIF